MSKPRTAETPDDPPLTSHEAGLGRLVRELTGQLQRGAARREILSSIVRGGSALAGGERALLVELAPVNPIGGGRGGRGGRGAVVPLVLARHEPGAAGAALDPTALNWRAIAARLSSATAPAAIALPAADVAPPSVASNDTADRALVGPPADVAPSGAASERVAAGRRLVLARLGEADGGALRVLAALGGADPSLRSGGEAGDCLAALETWAGVAAVALEQLALREAEERVRAEGEELRQISLTLAGSLELEVVLARVLEAVQTLVGADSASITLVGEHTGYVGRHYSTVQTGRPHWHDALVRLRPGGTSRQVLESHRPRFVADLTQDPASNPVMLTLGVRSTATLPMIARGRTIGLLFANYAQPHAFSAREAELLGALAAHAAVALENARLHAEMTGAATDLRAVLESIEHGVIMTDRAGRIRFVNRRLGELLRVDVAEIVGRPTLEVAEKFIARRVRDPEAFMARLAWLYEHPAEVATDEITLTRPEVCVLRRYSGPMYDPLRDEVVGRIEVYTDFTEARRLEWARDEFLSTASHELKTPIMTLGGYLELLERQAARPEGPDPAQVTRYVGTAQRELERLRHLSEDMLDVARIEAGRFTLRPKEADLAAIVRETVERFARRPGPRGHDQQSGSRADGQAGSRPIVCHAAEALPGHYDPLRLGQVFTNLLENALKYSPAGREVVVEAGREGDQALLSVRDYGIGVPAVDRDNIFLPFYRARNASHGSSEGLGLGLYISRGIVEGHGGRLWVEPAQGGGSLFRVALPLGERSREATQGKSAAPRDLPQPEGETRDA